MSEVDPPRESEIDPPRAQVSLFELAWTFNHIALASFGGGLSAWSREVLVVEKQWMGETEFLSAMTMCRILPGANQVNMAVFAGSKMRGLPGAAVAVFGLCLMPVVLILVAGFFYFRFKEIPAVKGVLHGGLRTERPCAVATSGGSSHPRAGQPDLGVAEKSGCMIHTYLQLAGLFASLSLLSIGGGNAVLPEMHLQAVRGHHWMTNSQFADIFSISQTAPGPSSLIVTLVGYGAGLTVGGVPGAIVGGLIATVAMLLPAASLMYAVTLFWQRAQKSKWRIAVEKGFAPLTVGLIMATSLVMSRAADHDWRAYTLTAICTAIFVFTKTNPLIVVFAAGVLGYFGIV